MNIEHLPETCRTYAQQTFDTCPTHTQTQCQNMLAAYPKDVLATLPTHAPNIPNNMPQIHANQWKYKGVIEKCENVEINLKAPIANKLQSLQFHGHT